MSIVSNKPTITRKELEGVLDCLINDELTSGEAVKIFEKALCELTGYKNSVAINSATSAYHLAFTALGIEEGDEIILPSYFSSHALNAIKICRAIPVLIDIDDNSLSASPDKYAIKINDKTKAIIMGHTGGIYIDSSSFKELTVPVIEDISHCIGIESKEGNEGYFGSIAVCSFSPNDMITTGNGAAVFTNNTRFYSTIREKRYNEETTHFDYSMTDFQAAMGISQISRIQDFIRRRIEIAKIYYDRVRLTQHSVLLPFSSDYIYQSFPVIFDATYDKIVKFFKKNGIELYSPVPKPLHSYLNLKGMDYPNSDRMCKKMFSLPIYPTLTKNEIEKIGRTVAKFI
ncbi:MAG TPA: DegT/DnrJ/EryC1/StrS aminotransferase family protein [Spirochaetota bacterium]|nr:DegT/DnrJ/EryC1/StrS aminotransferase family protein [Spirochaetota bacterium]